MDQITLRIQRVGFVKPSPYDMYLEPVNRQEYPGLFDCLSANLYEDRETNIIDRGTTINLIGMDAEARIISGSEHNMRRLLALDYFVLDSVRVRRSEKAETYIKPTEYDGGRVTEVVGWVPTSEITVLNSPDRENERTDDLNQEGDR